MGSHDDDLIRIWIEDHPHRAGPADARVREYAVAVWAIVAYWQQAVGNDVEAVARDYRQSLTGSRLSATMSRQ